MRKEKIQSVAFIMSRVISKLRRVAYMVGSHVSLSSRHIRVPCPRSTRNVENIVEVNSKQQSVEKARKRERRNIMQSNKLIKGNASRSKEEAGILKTFCVENEGPSRKEQQRIEKKASEKKS